MKTLFKLVVNAGNHNRTHCPVSYWISSESPLLQGSGIELLRLTTAAGEVVPLQCEESEGNVTLHWIVQKLDAGESAVFVVEAGDKRQEAVEGLTLIEKENRMDVHIGGTYFTSYVYDAELAKPYLGPVIGPYGESFTRLDFETKEHPHHRSVWLAVGDVNGVDLWNEPKDRHGIQTFDGFKERVSGPVFARLTASQQWCNNGKRPQMAEKRTMTFYNTPAGERFIDLDTELRALGRIEFGATKEAGPLGIRVAESMKAENGGTIVNAFGSVGEAECWGQRAPWCDYYGNVGGQTLGIAAFDHPDNMDFPTFWHVRDYGLLAANNLYFLGGKLFQKGETIRYRHRIYFHEGDTLAAGVAGKYHDYIHPPVVKLEEQS
ncbi:PmoA family protein [Paenibacillus allorhizosphaerae]|uniref:Methane oxygenase PmoA n=1 Tax=Paenibacillus allorhizosphaerae TaxID=2849866 RepID=A0ABM8VS04_9BACL|nr:PmoA family protein [Paenibacillus allorhizosphaerae]CAG7655857.1 hypothetical protein PAECIP111802_06230 [Paenibacillus allorhizosphaerae]